MSMTPIFSMSHWKERKLDKTSFLTHNPLPYQTTLQYLVRGYRLSVMHKLNEQKARLGLHSLYAVCYDQY